MIIGICGLIGSGKGTTSDILVSEYNFQKISFADALKDTVSTIFKWNRTLLEGDTIESRQWREQPDNYWSAELGKTVTPRLVLQLVGTECMRHGFYDGIWTSIVKKTILDNPTINWVIPDLRFKNEIEMLRSIDGKIWEVTTNNDPKWKVQYEQNNVIPDNIHISEWDWIKVPKDIIIHNTSTKEYINTQIEKIIKR